jgi:hypothetical protein
MTYDLAVIGSEGAAFAAAQGSAAAANALLDAGQAGNRYGGIP